MTTIVVQRTTKPPMVPPTMVPTGSAVDDTTSAGAVGALREGVALSVADVVLTSDIDDDLAAVEVISSSRIPTPPVVRHAKCVRTTPVAVLGLDDQVKQKGCVDALRTQRLMLLSIIRLRHHRQMGSLTSRRYAAHTMPQGCHNQCKWYILRTSRPNHWRLWRSSLYTSQSSNTQSP